jgi:phosphoinositide-3-kinase regulatory subunit 4
MQISTLTPSDALIWPEYILPNMRHLSSDPATSTRVGFAQLIAPIAETSVRFLEMAQVLKMHAKRTDQSAGDYELQGAEASFTNVPDPVAHENIRDHTTLTSLIFKQQSKNRYLYSLQIRRAASSGPFCTMSLHCASFLADRKRTSSC